MPRAAINGETISEIAKRCALLPVMRSTSGERIVADAGWLPFHMFDRQIVQRDVEILGGLAGADGMCRPVDFNVFVFVSGRLAGTLSPADMASRTDASIAGGIRLAEDELSPPSSPATSKRTPSAVPLGVSLSDTGSTARRLRLSWFRSARGRRDPRSALARFLLNDPAWV